MKQTTTQPPATDAVASGALLALIDKLNGYAIDNAKAADAKVKNWLYNRGASNAYGVAAFLLRECIQDANAEVRDGLPTTNPRKDG